MDNCNYNRQQQYQNRQQRMYGSNRNQNVRMGNNGACNECDNEPKCEVSKWPLAMAYVPWQKWGKVYEPCKALYVGTIFPVLDLPFMGRSCGRR